MHNLDVHVGQDSARLIMAVCMQKALPCSEVQLSEHFQLSQRSTCSIPVCTSTRVQFSQVQAN